MIYFGEFSQCEYGQATGNLKQNLELAKSYILLKNMELFENYPTKIKITTKQHNYLLFLRPKSKY